MRRQLASILLLILVAGFSPVPPEAQAYNAQTAEDYLRTHNFSAWSVMGLAASGAAAIDANHLKTVNSSQAIDYAAPVLAIAGLNQDARSFGSHDYVAALKSFQSGGQLGDPSLLNDDIFGLLALVASGEPLSDATISVLKAYVLSQQNSDGGWGFVVGGSSDTNMTSASILALLSAGLVPTASEIAVAQNYLQAAQNDDGGFPYDPVSSFGTASDTASTAWVVWALNALGIGASGWSKNGNSPQGFLEARQTSAGYFEYQQGSGEDSFTPITTSYAVIALTGKKLPLKIYAATEEPQFAFRIEGRNEQICAGNSAGPTALDIVKNASVWCGFTYHISQTSFGPYLDAINNDAASGLTGWLYLVNFVPPSVGAADYVLQEGEEVVWYYGEFGWLPMRLSLSAGVVSAGESVIVTVEGLQNGSWMPVDGTTVFYGTENTSTNSFGQAVITSGTGFYQIFAEKTGYVRTERETVQVGAPVSATVGLGVTVEEGSVLGDTISFIVSPSAVDFGVLKPGQSSQASVSLTNTGTMGLHMESIVSGDEVFEENLKVMNERWPNFAFSLSAGQAQDMALGLTIPTGASSGAKSGEITFWASALQ